MRQFLLLSAFLLFAGCNTVHNPGAALLRIDNASSTDFISVVVDFLGNENEEIYGIISSGQHSGDKKIEPAYRYGFIEVESRGSTYRLTPNDYVEESPLDHGRYTYKLDIVDDHLNLEFRKE